MFNKFNKIFATILGLDSDWKKQWKEDTDKGIEEIKEEFNKRGMFLGGLTTKEINQYINKREQDQKDEERKRLLEGLSVLPGWVALIISIIAIIVSIFLNR